jgi:hypothetical protein
MTNRSVLAWAMFAGLFVAVSLVGLGAIMGAEWGHIGLEISKAGVQLGILSVIGGAFAAVLKYLESAREGRRHLAESTREEHRRLNEYRLSVLRSLTISYNRIKAVRRTLPAFGFGAGTSKPLTVEQVSEFHAQMKSLNEAQLAIERLKRELQVWPDVFSESKKFTDLLGSVDEYVRPVIKDWERSGSEVLPGAAPQTLLRSMSALNAFLAPSEEGFEKGAATPMDSLENLIRSQVLPSSEAAPTAFEVS